MSDSLFEDDDFESFAGAPSGDFLADSAADDIVDGASLADTPPGDIEIPVEADEADEADAEAGEQSSNEATNEALVPAAATGGKKKGRLKLSDIDWSEMTIYDSMLLVSVLAVSMAILMLFFELRQFGNFPFGGFPWRTPGF